MKLLTDYPLFVEEYDKAGPFRLVTVLDYDADKYCVIEFDGEQYDVKRGYLYRSRRRVPVKHETMCRWFNKEP